MANCCRGCLKRAFWICCGCNRIIFLMTASNNSCELKKSSCWLSTAYREGNDLLLFFVSVSGFHSSALYYCNLFICSLLWITCRLFYIAWCASIQIRTVYMCWFIITCLFLISYNESCLFLALWSPRENRDLERIFIKNRVILPGFRDVFQNFYEL